jgi:hypothetical protein
MQNLLSSENAKSNVELPKKAPTPSASFSLASLSLVMLCVQNIEIVGYQTNIEGASVSSKVYVWETGCLLSLCCFISLVLG